jgi:hypothetical protein
MRFFAIGIEDADGGTVQRLQRPNARELDGAAMFGRVCQKLGGCQHGRRATLICRDGLDEVRDRLAQGCQLGKVGQHNRLGKAQGPGHDKLRNRTGIQADAGWLVPEEHRSLTEKRPQLREGWSRLTWGLCRGAAQHDATMRPQSADASKFYFREAHFLLARHGYNAQAGVGSPGATAQPVRFAGLGATAPN